MSKMKGRKFERVLTERQVEIAELRKIPRIDRTPEQYERLRDLLAKERRERFLNLYPRRRDKVGQALTLLANLANVQNYQYEPDEAASIIAGLKKKVAEVEFAFRGATKEKGMWDF